MPNNEQITVDTGKAAVMPESLVSATHSVAAHAPELTVVIPTYNERENVPLLVDRLNEVLHGVRWEAIFVDDDSPDDTATVVRGLNQRQPHIRCLQRIGRRGLSSACVEGFLASGAPYIAVMDADLQHDENLLPLMLDRIKREGLDIVIGSRYTGDGGVGDWDRKRVAISGFATRLSRLIVKADLSDPMSGFFLVSRPAFEGALRQLSTQGFKILLDLFASSKRPLRFVELPFQFRQRVHGESKLDALVIWEYLTLLIDKLIGHFVPVRFVMFAAVGGLGVFIHLLALGLSTQTFGMAFAAAQALATGVAMTANFLLNNVLTYRDLRLRGWRLWTGLLAFYAVCSVGAIANVGIASYIFESNARWWLAGLTGALVGAVWNYSVSSVFTWRSKQA